MRIVFMGTPQCAATALEALLENFYEVVGVFTQPDKPSGRGKELKAPAVKELAEKYGLPVFQPENLTSIDVLQDLDLLLPDIIIVVAYGKIIPKQILDYPNHGCINIHFSLLPKYRGAAPIAYAVKNGEEETGISIFKLEEKLDTGPIYSQVSIDITEDDTTQTLEEKLTTLSIPLLFKTLSDIVSGEADCGIQNDEEATYAPQFKKSDGLIDWTKSSDEIFNHIRAMNPWPCAYTQVDSKMLKVWGARKILNPKSQNPNESGKIIEINNDGIVVGTGDGAILLTEVQIESSRRMSAADFIKGHSIKAGDILR